MALHFALVDEIMKWGRVRPDAVLTMDTMVAYPSASHWLAAVFGWMFSSGLVGLSVIAITAIYTCYFFIGRLLLLHTSSLILPIFVVLFAVLARTHAQVGWEVIGNFFYPQIVAFALYFGIMFWLAQQHDEHVWPVVVAAIFNLLIYVTQPVAGVHLTAALVAFLAVNFVCIRYFKGQWSLPHLGAIAITSMLGLAILRLHPDVYAIIRISNWNGDLDFRFPGSNIVLPVLVCMAGAAINLRWGMARWPSGREDRLLGAAGVASGGLMFLQHILLIAFGTGSYYAVKKHVFIIVTLGAINIARILTRHVPYRRFQSALNPAWQPMAAICMAVIATIVVLNHEQGLSLPQMVSLQKFSEHFAATSPEFRPENTTVAAQSATPVSSLLISITAFSVPYARAVSNFGNVDPQSKYLIVDRTDDLAGCAVAGNYLYLAVSSTCFATEMKPGSLVKFGRGEPGTRYLRSGWFTPEDWGTWGGARSVIDIKIPKQSYKLTASVRAFLVQGHAEQSFDVIVSGRTVATWYFTLKESMANKTAEVPADLITENSTTEFAFVSTTPLVSPKRAGVGDDSRELGIGIETMRLE